MSPVGEGVVNEPPILPGDPRGALETRATVSLELPAALLESIVEAVTARVLERLEQAAATGNGGPPWLTLEQAAERLGCSPDAVRMRAKRGRLEARRDGRRVYVSRRSVDALP